MRNEFRALANEVLLPDQWPCAHGAPLLQDASLQATIFLNKQKNY